MIQADKPPRWSEDGSLVVEHPFQEIPGKQCDFAYDSYREKAGKFLLEEEDGEPEAALENKPETLACTSEDLRDVRNGEKAANHHMT